MSTLRGWQLEEKLYLNEVGKAFRERPKKTLNEVVMNNYKDLNLYREAVGGHAARQSAIKHIRLTHATMCEAFLNDDDYDDHKDYGFSIMVFLHDKFTGIIHDKVN